MPTSKAAVPWVKVGHFCHYCISENEELLSQREPPPWAELSAKGAKGNLNERGRDSKQINKLFLIFSLFLTPPLS